MSSNNPSVVIRKNAASRSMLLKNQHSRRLLEIVSPGVDLDTLCKGIYQNPIGVTLLRLFIAPLQLTIYGGACKISFDS